MKCYILNKFKIDKIACTLNVLFWIINITFFQTCFNLLIKAISTGKSKWFDEALKRQVTDDPFIIYKTELLMTMLLSILCIILTFLIISIVYCRKVQLKNIMSQIGIYRVVGYERKTLVYICMVETVIDMLVAMPISLVLFLVLENVLLKNELMSVLLYIMNANLLLDIVSYILCWVLILLVTIIHTKIFLERSLKKGIRYMLGQGVE